MDSIGRRFLVGEQKCGLVDAVAVDVVSDASWDADTGNQGTGTLKAEHSDDFRKSRSSLVDIE